MTQIISRPAGTRSLPVVLVEDIRMLRDSISTMLRAQGVKVVAAVRTGEEALRQILKLDPGLMLIDSTLGAGHSSQLVETVTRSAPAARVVVMDVQPSQRDVIDFVRAGAAGFILKDATAADVVSTLRQVANGLCVLPPTLASIVFSHIAGQGARPRTESSAVDRLTHREREIIDLIRGGSSNKEISSRLHISVHTVKSHVHSVLEKLALSTRLQVSAFARAPDFAARMAI